jgi:hypothetical protein
MVQSEFADRIITLCGKNWANIGVEFIYYGGAEDCNNCRLKNTCLNLREKSKYKIVGLREGSVQDCPIHDEGVIAVEVVELPALGLIEPKKAVSGTKLKYESKKCDVFQCPMFNLCHPVEIEGEKVVVLKVIGDAPYDCQKGYSFKVVEFQRKEGDR